MWGSFLLAGRGAARRRRFGLFAMGVAFACRLGRVATVNLGSRAWESLCPPVRGLANVRGAPVRGARRFGSARKARGYPRRRLRNPAGVIPGLPCPVQKARRSGGGSPLSNRAQISWGSFLLVGRGRLAGARGAPVRGARKLAGAGKPGGPVGAASGTPPGSFRAYRVRYKGSQVGDSLPLSNRARLLWGSFLLTGRGQLADMQEPPVNGAEPELPITAGLSCEPQRSRNRDCRSPPGFPRASKLPGFPSGGLPYSCELTPNRQAKALPRPRAQIDSGKLALTSEPFASDSAGYE